MEIVLSVEILLVFFLYTCVVLQFIFFAHRLTPLTSLIFVIALAFTAWICDLLSHLSAPFITLLFLSAYCAIDRPRKHLLFSSISIVVLALLSLLFAIHKIPGFNESILFSSDAFGASGLPFQLKANLDKALAALALLIAFSQQVKWQISLSDFRFIIISLLGFFSVCWLMGADTEPKFGELTFAFMFFNLFVTCLAEEAFFRLIIQTKLTQWFSGPSAPYLAVLITGVIFMLAHFHTGEGADKRLALILLAGLLYGMAYMRSKSLGSAIALHFSINIIHFSFFAYPATFSG